MLKAARESKFMSVRTSMAVANSKKGLEERRSAEL